MTNIRVENPAVTLRYGTCVRCAGRFTLTRDGWVAGHLDPEDQRQPRRRRCPGAGGYAVEHLPARRCRLPPDRRAVTKTLRAGPVAIEATVGFYPDGRPGELFLRVTEPEGTLAGMLDGLAVAVSMGLQHGMPLSTLATKWRGTRFAPRGPTGEEGHPFASSILDALAVWLAGLDTRRPVARPNGESS